MALIEINMNPSRTELKWFGLLLLAFFALIAGIVFWATSASKAPAVLLFIGAALCVVYYSLRPLRLPLYRLWMRMVFPIGWTLSHLLFGFIYYLTVTPVGLLLRLFGHDPLHRRRDPGAGTYWMEHRPNDDPASYFRQF